jgi:methionine-rich copper-binding protein CopC
MGETTLKHSQISRPQLARLRTNCPYLRHLLSDEQGQAWDLAVLIAYSGFGAIIGAVLGLIRGGLRETLTGWTVRGACWGAILGGLLGGLLGAGVYFIPDKSREAGLLVVLLVVFIGGMTGAIIGFEAATTPWSVGWTLVGSIIGGALGGILGGTIIAGLHSYMSSMSFLFVLYGFAFGAPIGVMIGTVIGGAAAVIASVSKAVWPTVSAALRYSPAAPYAARLRRVLWLGAIGGGLVLLLAGTIDRFAEPARYVSSTPAPKAMLAEGATSITIAFSAELDPTSRASVVTTGRHRGRDVSTGSRVNPEDPQHRSLVVDLMPGLPHGDYRVDWQSVARSGKVIAGYFYFGVGAPGPAWGAYREWEPHWHTPYAMLLAGMVIVALSLVVPLVTRWAR